MSQKVQVTITCDIDGPDSEPLVGEHHHRRTFSPDGKQEYEIDLCGKHNKEFDRDTGPFVTHARRAGTKPRIIREARSAPSRPPSTGPADTRPPTAAQPQPRATARASTPTIRAWAKSQGYHVKDRGRLGADIVAQYERSH